jgi:nitroreductase
MNEPMQHQRDILQHLVNLLEYERRRREGLEARAGTVITTAGAVASLLVAAAALGRDTVRTSNSWPFVVPSLIGLLLFAFASLLALRALVPGRAPNKSTNPMDRWNDPQSSALNRHASDVAAQLDNETAVCASKARFVSWAYVAEIGAVGAFAVALLALGAA